MHDLINKHVMVFCTQVEILYSHYDCYSIKTFNSIQGVIKRYGVGHKIY